MKTKARVNDQEFVLADPAKFRPLPGNPRVSDEKMVEASLDAHGFYGAIIVQRSTGHIIVGNHRWELAKAKGLRRIPAILIDVTDEQALGIALADNRTGDLGSYVETRLSSLLQSIQEANPEDGLERAGYTDADLERLRGEAAGVEELLASLDTASAPTPPLEPIPEVETAPIIEPGHAGIGGVMHGKTPPLLRFGRWRLVMHERDLAALERMADAYQETHGTASGFGGALVRAARIGMR